MIYGGSDNMKRNVYVIGGANVDVQGFAHQDLVRFDSNPGTITTSFGGVGRNIAENLARLHVPVTLISVVGEDAAGKALWEHAQACGIDTRFLLRLPHASTSHYLALMNANHEMELAISDMSILDQLTLDQLRPMVKEIGPQDYVVLDGNLSEETLQALVSMLPCRIVADPISAHKAVRLQSCLSHLYAIKPNRYEAEVLVGFPLQGEADYHRAVDALLQAGVQQVWLTLGEEGVLLGTTNERRRLTFTPTSVESATGAGDAFFAGALAALLHDGSLMDVGHYAITCAAFALSTSQTVNEAVTPAIIQAALQNDSFRIKEVSL
jgi:pseudouridine kinase